jgi:hypothetical protein
MAHFAELDGDNVVLRVVVVSNEQAPTEQAGIDYLNSTPITEGTWKQTSYNTKAGVHLLGGTPFRKNYAGRGYTYNADLDAFISPKPFPSWILNETKGIYEAPVASPEGNRYAWNEAEQRWDLR